MKIRLWKLGSLEHKVMPRREAFIALKAILAEAANQEGIMDMVWDPAITVQEIEVTPEGVNVVTGDGDVTPELREKIERVIQEHLGGA